MLLQVAVHQSRVFADGPVHGPLCSAGMLTTEVLGKAKQGAIFVNVGRGNVCTEDTLLALLDSQVLLFQRH